MKMKYFLISWLVGLAAGAAIALPMATVSGAPHKAVVPAAESVADITTYVEKHEVDVWRTIGRIVRADGATCEESGQGFDVTVLVVVYKGEHKVLELERKGPYQLLNRSIPETPDNECFK